MKELNKSILKHEIRGMKWMLLLSTLTSLFIVTVFSSYLDEGYERMFSYGIFANETPILSAFRDVNYGILIGFTLIAIVQVFIQFRSEKGQETGRFLKFLPVKKEDFFKIKLITGIINLSLAFGVLAIGIVVVRNNNMFWIKDIHSISSASEILIRLGSVENLLKEIGLIYLVILSFYTFLFMIQYTFTNTVGAIVTGILVWLAPLFIVFSSIFTLEKITSISFYNSTFLNKINVFADWLLPHIYPLDYRYLDELNLNFNSYGGNISIVDKLGMKYIIVIVLIGINIAIAYKFNKSSKVENENKVIVFKGTKNIFKLGVTVCSGLLVSIVLGEILRIQTNRILHILFILLGGLIGYLVSHRITKVEKV